MAFHDLSPDCRWISRNGRWSYRVPGHMVACLTGESHMSRRNCDVDKTLTTVVTDALNHVEFLFAQMADHEASWSLGAFGAIAEFARKPDEPVEFSRADAALAAVTARGGIRIAPREQMRLFASESTTRESWAHRVSLCLPDDRCGMNARTVITALGPDVEALRSEDRAAVLFDLGLGALQVDACVRLSDPEVTAAR
jgi:hypothetical protein